jgi:hypothetical protein
VAGTTTDKFLGILQRAWNESEAFLDTNVVAGLLGSEEAAGHLLAWLLASDLRGWHSIAANELRKMVARRLAPPDVCLEKLWDYAHASITSDQDEMPNLFALMHLAKSDSVRQWFARPLISLCEREANAYRRFGFEGLECLVKSGGATHLRPFLPIIARLAGTAEDPVYQDAAKRILRAVGDMNQDDRIRGVWIKDSISNWIDRHSVYRTTNGPFEKANNYALHNTLPAYATE